MPKLHSIVKIPQGVGRVIEVFAACFIVRVYDKYDVTVYVNDQWEITDEQLS